MRSKGRASRRSRFWASHSLRLTRRAGDSDLLAFARLELHWLPRGGVLDSALDMLAIEAITGPMTMRTAGTIRELAGRHMSG